MRVGRKDPFSFFYKNDYFFIFNKNQNDNIFILKYRQFTFNWLR